MASDPNVRHTGLEPQASRQGPRQACYSHVAPCVAGFVVIAEGGFVKHVLVDEGSESLQAR